MHEAEGHVITVNERHADLQITIYNFDRVVRPTESFIVPPHRLSSKPERLIVVSLLRQRTTGIAKLRTSVQQPG